MIRFLRKYTRQFALIMTVVMINLSIDAPDPVRFVDHKFVSDDDLSVNEIESISEWFLEHVLHIHNAVPERNEDDSSSIVKHFVDYYFVNNHFIATVIPSCISISFKVVHFFAPSFWDCDHVFILIQPPRQ